MIEINKISTSQADIIKSFALFYLLLIGSYVSSSVITCYQIQTIRKNVWLQLFLVFFLCYFLVGIKSKILSDDCVPPIEKLIYTFFYFIGFLFVMRLDITITSIVIFLIFMIYFIELNKNFYLDVNGRLITTDTANTANKNNTNTANPNTNDACNANRLYWISLSWPFTLNLFPIKQEHFTYISKVETVIYYLILILLVFGFVAYRGEIKDSLIYDNKTTVNWFSIIMNTNTCDIKSRKGIWQYFKMGLTI
jgi:hypothetical protein